VGEEDFFLDLGKGVNLGMEKLVQQSLTPSPQEFLAWERAAEFKHEYFKGDVVDFAGASLRHNFIAANLMREVGTFLKGKRCQILPSEIRIAAPMGEAYMYPDAVIVCGEPEMVDDRFDTMLNPVVIFEILSPSTQDHDRKRKFSFYQKIPSFKEYILIDSTRQWVEFGLKQPDCSWVFESTANPEGYVPITSIKGFIEMEELYRNVKLSA
jgi:Uma2 family endonuclease